MIVAPDPKIEHVLHGPQSPQTQSCCSTPHSQSAQGKYSIFFPGQVSHAGMPTSQVWVASIGINVFLQEVEGAWER